MSASCAGLEHRLNLAPQAIEGDIHDLALVARAGIADHHLEHEAVDLGFGQRIGSLLLDRVLRGQDEKRLVERERFVADRDLMLLHRLQQRRLHLGRRAVDLVGQNEVGEDRALAGAERPFARIIDQRADQVGRQQVRRELNAVELAMDRRRQRLDGRGLGQAGHALEQDVPAGEQRDQQPRQHHVLPDQDLANLRFDPFELVRILENLILDLLDVDAHIL